VEREVEEIEVEEMEVEEIEVEEMEVETEEMRVVERETDGGGTVVNIIEIPFEVIPSTEAMTTTLAGRALMIWLYADPAPSVVAYLGVITGITEFSVKLTVAPCR